MQFDAREQGYFVFVCCCCLCLCASWVCFDSAGAATNVSTTWKATPFPEMMMIAWKRMRKLSWTKRRILIVVFVSCRCSLANSIDYDSEGSHKLASVAWKTDENRLIAFYLCFRCCVVVVAAASEKETLGVTTAKISGMIACGANGMANETTAMDKIQRLVQFSGRMPLLLLSNLRNFAGSFADSRRQDCPLLASFFTDPIGFVTGVCQPA
mmetsp:Transcript_25043/g.58752  ORF Transcript_25043/g.58752 Transcript_25043/m.58752 type:complete len:211 (-) Transcript_25043:8-640(-)